jgi:hypothetical protein
MFAPGFFGWLASPSCNARTVSQVTIPSQNSRYDT